VSHAHLSSLHNSQKKENDSIEGSVQFLRAEQHRPTILIGEKTRLIIPAVLTDVTIRSLILERAALRAYRRISSCGMLILYLSILLHINVHIQ
jgi:hypothetical protein